MRNHIKILFSVTLITSAVAAQAQVNTLDRYVQNDLIKICEAIQSDNRSKIRNAVRHSRISLTAIQEKLKCNGLDPVSFGLAMNADSSVNYMVARLPQSSYALAMKKMKNNKTSMATTITE